MIITKHRQEAQKQPQGSHSGSQMVSQMGSTPLLTHYIMKKKYLLK